MELHTNRKREIGTRSPMIYGQFIEHFHRQIYGGIFDPDSPFADEDGMRTDVLEALKKIRVPILRWPGGCFASAYHWKDGVGQKRRSVFDKAWRVEEANTFGTDEYIKFCRKLGCEPYICTNAGTGSPEEMSDWVEYCNLNSEGNFAKWRAANGHPEPYKVKYWSIGNENYGFWEMGAKKPKEWAQLVRESAKMIKRVDPKTELSAAALTDLNWDLALLENCGEYLDWISIHEYWDAISQTNDYATYEQAMAYTDRIGHSIDEVRGLLCAMKLERKIRIAFDEWNLRAWFHPNIMTVRQGVAKEEYLLPRDENDDNTKYTMADAVFTACFLNELNRNCDLVGMANFSPAVNTRGCIYTYPEGIVLRPTYHVFDLYVNYLGDVVLDSWCEDMPQFTVRDKKGEEHRIDALDVVTTGFSDKPGLAVAAVNKDPEREHTLKLSFHAPSGRLTLWTISGNSTESYNDVNHEEVGIKEKTFGSFKPGAELPLSPHSVNLLLIR